MIKVDNLTLHQVRIDDDAGRASICKESFFELQDVAMLVIKAPNKSLQRDFKFSSAIEPGAMDTVTGPINVTTPHALEAHQDIAGNARSHLFQLVRKRNCRLVMQAMDRSKPPLGLRPIARTTQVQLL